MAIERLRAALFISGRGSTAAEIIKACRDGFLPHMEVVCVIRDKPEAGAAIIGPDLPLMIDLDWRGLVTIERRTDAIIEIFERLGVSFFGQHGWMPKMPEGVISDYFGINQHNGPLDPGYPDFGGQGMYGRRTLAARLYFARMAGEAHWWTEATAQEVHPDFDRGHVINVETVPILPTDTVDSLGQRLIMAEHRVQIRTWAEISEARLALLIRDERLVSDDQLPLLEEAKRIATIFYPKG
jgi:phosphoribosylglycinamide formyltransferase-1